MEDIHSTWNEMVHEFTNELIFEVHEFDEDFKESVQHRRRLLGWFSSIWNTAIKAITHATIGSAVASGYQSTNCQNREFKNWLGNIFIITSTKVCTNSVFGICITIKCSPAMNIFSAAITSSKWNWNKQECSHYISGHSKSDDMICSNPNPDPHHNALFESVCKIHDMCLKTNGRSSSLCHNEFYHNMKQQCYMQYPEFSTSPALGTCLAASSAWAGVAHLFGNHWGGISHANCVL